MTDTMSSQMASVELDRRWLRGDPGAFDEAYGKYRSRLEAVVYRVVRMYGGEKSFWDKSWEMPDVELVK